jgi:hypothetical protein
MSTHQDVQVVDLSNLLKEAAQVSVLSEQSKQRSKVAAQLAQKSSNYFKITVITIVLSIIAYFAGNVHITSMKYPNIAAWYKYADELASENPRLKSAGIRNYGLYQLTVTANFRMFASVMNALTLWKDLSHEGAVFLTNCINHLSANKAKFNQLHWNGTAEQTNAAYLFAPNGFLCGANAVDYKSEAQKKLDMFTSWHRTRQKNIWYDLFPNTLPGLLSIQMFNDLITAGVCKNNMAGTILNTLYNGGLCEVAFQHATSDLTGHELFTYCFGHSSVEMKPSCKAQMIEGALNGVAGLGTIGPSLPGFNTMVVSNPVMTLGAVTIVAATGAFINAKAAQEQCQNYQ